MKRMLKTVTGLLIFALIAAVVFFYSIFVSVERLTVDYNTITSSKIPLAMEDVKIAFISDLQYNRFMDKERLSAMVKTINEVKPDIVIFGGDIFDLPLTYVPNDATKQEVSQLLKQIEAPLGKFAVLGEQDNVDEGVRSMVVDALMDSDFELLNNTAKRLRNGTDDSITLIGVDSLINGTPDFNLAFANAPEEQFRILVTHCPDLVQAEGFASNRVDLMLAGHSHAAQIYIPLIGSLSSDEGATLYNHGKHRIDHMILHITNGMGTTTMDMRLFSPPQMIVYRLKHEQGTSSSSSPDTPINEQEQQENTDPNIEQEADSQT